MPTAQCILSKVYGPLICTKKKEPLVFLLPGAGMSFTKKRELKKSSAINFPDQNLVWQFFEFMEQKCFEQKKIFRRKEEKCFINPPFLFLLVTFVCLAYFT